MARIVWQQQGQTQYEFGVDRGVFYDSDSKGYSWSGLTSVEEGAVGGELDPLHFDGIKYLDRVAPRNYKAVVSAYSAPKPLLTALGNEDACEGFTLTRQKRSRFGFCYRTSLGRPDGYKIHLVYNALAIPTDRGFSTITDTPTATIFAWQIEAVPPFTRIARPTAHFILDSTEMQESLFATFEDILYGNEDEDARLPTIEELLDLLQTAWTPTSIEPRSDTGLSVLVPDGDDLYNTLKPGLNRDLPQTSLVPSDIPGLYRLE